MKKIIALALSLILVLSLSVTAFAAGEITAADGTDDAVATGKYQAGEAAETVYSVDVVWDGMASFVYKDTVAGAWNAENHSYDGYVAAHWEGEGSVEVTNHSNADVEVTVEADAEDGFEVDLVTEATDLVLGAGVEGKYDEAESLAYTITITEGVLTDANADEAATLATITVTIKAVG